MQTQHAVREISVPAAECIPFLIKAVQSDPFITVYVDNFQKPSYKTADFPLINKHKNQNYFHGINK